MPRLRLPDDGIDILVPDDLRVISTYVLLEQERWFEKEIDFVRALLKPGMRAIDVGANVGVYALMMAARVGPSGHVLAFEPASGPRGLLEASRTANGFGHLEIASEALSDREGAGRLAHAGSSELNRLSSEGPGEAVAVTTLDRALAARGWAGADFVKIDAEGEEAAIVEGGLSLFADASPLVMFEIKDGERRTETCMERLAGLGYRMFRLVPGLGALVPLGAPDALDAAELNVFAAKPNRAAALGRDGLLLTQPPRPAAAGEIAAWLARGERPAPACASLASARPAPPYGAVLDAFAATRSPGLGLPERAAALETARNGARALTPEAARSGARLTTLARIAADAGERTAAIDLLGRFLALLQAPAPAAIEPFWPPLPTQDRRVPQGAPAQMLATFALEGLACLSVFSGIFGGEERVLAWVCAQPDAAPESLRRLALMQALAGRPQPVPERLAKPAPGHAHAHLWADGTVERLMRAAAARR